ncbi:hypothetical protein [Microcoleus sp. herbarium14]|uniref:hypothetical protein n=1 Tax=Microcoleus sp. herbarium14 TaxID=3055439 RepID=UPI002FD71122
MNDRYFYEQSIYDAIASHIGLKFSNLRFFPKILSLPQNDYELFDLLDIIPSSAPLFKINNDVPRLSSTYSKLLQSQQDSLILQIAKKNFENTNNWLPGDPSSNLPKTPMYTPTCTDIRQSVQNGGLFEFSIDTSMTPSPNKSLEPSLPNFVVYEPFRMFNEIAGGNRFVFKIRFDKMTSPSVRPGAWFSNPLLTQAFTNPDKWLTGPDIVTWNSLFGDNGTLKFTIVNILAVSGMKLEVQSFGNYDNAMLNALKINEVATSIWPFYLNNVKHLSQKIELGSDKSIKITTSVDSPEILLLFMGVESLSKLITGTAIV